MADKKQKTTALIEVTIEIEGHTHQGEPVKKGNKIKVTAEQQAWLKKNNIIEVTHE